MGVQWPGSNHEAIEKVIIDSRNMNVMLHTTKGRLLNLLFVSCASPIVEPSPLPDLFAAPGTKEARRFKLRFWRSCLSRSRMAPTELGIVDVMVFDGIS